MAGFRNTASFGKRMEYVVVAELLRRGYDVYMPLVDDQGIDCILRKGDSEYIDIQIKARSHDCSLSDGWRFAAMAINNPRYNYFFIFYSSKADCYWIAPSLDLVNEAYCNENGNNVGKYHINLCGHSKKDGSVHANPKFDKWKNRFDLLGLCCPPAESST